MKPALSSKAIPKLDPITERFVAGISAAADAFAVAYNQGRYDVTHPWCHAAATRKGNVIIIEISLDA